MQFTCEKQIIKTALDKAKQAVSSNTNVPILSHICLKLQGDRLEVSATDTSTSIIARIDVVGKEDGGAAVPCDSLTKIVNSLEPGDIEFALDSKAMFTISTKNSHYKLPTLPSEEFPALSVPEAVGSFDLEGKELASMLGTVKFACADAASTRVNLQSILFDIVDGTLILVSTDGKRMAKCSCPLGIENLGNAQAIMPSKAVEKLYPLLKAEETIRVDICKKWIFFSNAGLLFGASLIDASYPDYSRFFANCKDGASLCTVDRMMLNNALKRVSLMAQEKTNKDLVKFLFEKDSITLSSSSADIGSGKEVVNSFFDGEPLELYFNGVFIMQALSALTCEQVEMNTKGANAGIVIRPQDSDSYDYICMPMRGH